jgi:hypothetical protein
LSDEGDVTHASSAVGAAKPPGAARAYEAAVVNIAIAVIRIAVFLIECSIAISCEV